MKKNAFTLATLIIFLALSVYIAWTAWWLQFMIWFFVYWLIFYILHILWSIIRKKDFMLYKSFVSYFAYRFSIFLIIITSLLWFFVYYENIYEPALLPEFTISNWDKTVVFQWMAHIWSDQFYKNIAQNVSNYKKQWYVLFYEWVRPWNKENSEKLNKLMWVEFNKKTYVNLSKIYWLRAQNNQEFLNLVNDKDYNVDVSMDEIITDYEKKYWPVKDKKTLLNSKNTNPIKVDSAVEEIINNITPRELEILKAINRAMMNMIVKSEWLQEAILQWTQQKDFFDIILNWRNKIIVNSINKSKDKKIVILYWLMHFNWVWSTLQKEDPNWSLKNIRYFKPID